MVFQERCHVVDNSEGRSNQRVSQLIEIASSTPSLSLSLQMALECWPPAIAVHIEQRALLQLPLGLSLPLRFDEQHLLHQAAGVGVALPVLEASLQFPVALHFRLEVSKSALQRNIHHIHASLASLWYKSNTVSEGKVNHIQFYRKCTRGGRVRASYSKATSRSCHISIIKAIPTKSAIAFASEAPGRAGVGFSEGNLCW